MGQGKGRKGQQKSQQDGKSQHLGAGDEGF